MEKKVTFERSSGWGSVIMRMGLIGEKGAVVFSLVTNWKTSAEVREFQMMVSGEMGEIIPEYQPHHASLLRMTWVPNPIDIGYLPNPIDIGYHSKTPMYEDQSPMGSKRIITKEKTPEDPIGVGMEDTGTFDPCEWVGNGPCYYDGSSLNAVRFFDILASRGEEDFWKAMEDYYNSTFDDEIVVPLQNEDKPQ